MNAEILSTGDELRSGSALDTNAPYIAKKLEDTGIRVVKHSCVGDEMEILVRTLIEIGSRADIAVVTGGLGPTADDITAMAAAKASGAKLARNEEAFLSIKRRFKKSGYKMRVSEEKQAMLPVGSDIIANKAGIAPGFSLKIGRSLFFFLPGVPSEMKKMLSESVLPMVEKVIGENRPFLKTITISAFGLAESDVDKRIEGFAEKFPGVKIGLRAFFPEIHVNLYARGKSEIALENILGKSVPWVRERLGENVFSVEGESFPEKIGRLLHDRNETLAIAESCTGGLISHMITDVPGSSDYFLLSKVTYSNESKINALNVSSSTIEKYGAVHENTAMEMASGVKNIAKATYGISTSGVAGPGGGAKKKPVGTVCIGIAGPNSVKGRRFYFPIKKRLLNKKIFAYTALDLLRKELI